jgi:hypothetical protein
MVLNKQASHQPTGCAHFYTLRPTPMHLAARLMLNKSDAISK